METVHGKILQPSSIFFLSFPPPLLPTQDCVLFEVFEERLTQEKTPKYSLGRWDSSTETHSVEHKRFAPPSPVLICRTQALGCLPKRYALAQPDMPGINTGIQEKCNSLLQAGSFQALIFT